MGKLVNGELVDLTAEDIAQQEADTADYEAKKTAKEDLKASAKAKLMSGEALTEDEANTIVL